MPFVLVLSASNNVCTKDKMGRLWEMKGNATKAVEWRTKNADMMICSNFKVSYNLLTPVGSPCDSLQL